MYHSSFSALWEYIRPCTTFMSFQITTAVPQELWMIRIMELDESGCPTKLQNIPIFFFPQREGGPKPRSTATKGHASVGGRLATRPSAGRWLAEGQGGQGDRPSDHFLWRVGNSWAVLASCNQNTLEFWCVAFLFLFLFLHIYNTALALCIYTLCLYGICDLNAPINIPYYRHSTVLDALCLVPNLILLSTPDLMVQACGDVIC